MKKILILVANRSVARLFGTDDRRGEPLHELATLTHPEGRLQDHDLVSDRPGRAFDSLGHHRHAADPDTTAEEHEAEAFAIELTRRLHKDRAESRFDALALVAAPDFLGLLRKHLDAPTRQRVFLEVDKNLAHLDAAAIRDHLPEKLDATDLD
jgi:protein required for attachment to host cells